MGLDHGKLLKLALGSGLALAALFPALAAATEISTGIMPAQAQEPSCSSMQYIENNPQGGTLSKSSCTSCQQAIQSAVKNANQQLSSAKTSDAGIGASTTAGTAATSGGTLLNQLDPQGKTSSVNNQGLNALNQQQQLAQGVAQGANACAQQIQSSCSGIAAEDQSAAQQSAQSCQKMGQQAQQVAGEKAAKAGEMAKNEGTSNGNGQKMGEMPQMPSGGQGGQGDGSGSGAGSGLSGLGSTPSDLASNTSALGGGLGGNSTSSDGTLASGTGANSGAGSGNSADAGSSTTGPVTTTPFSPVDSVQGSALPGGVRNTASIDSPSGGSSGVTAGHTGAAAGGAPAASSEGAKSAGLFSGFGGSGSGAGNGLGVTGGGGGSFGSSGSFNSSGASQFPGSTADAKSGGAGSGHYGGGSAAAEALAPYTGGSGGGYTMPGKSAVLGLEAEGPGNLNDIVTPSSLLADNGHNGGNGARDLQGGLTKQINETSLFQRISGTIRRISAIRTMQ